MSKRASPMVVGGFVIVAVALAVGAILVLAGGRMFRDTAAMIVYFDTSVGGLGPGSPVKFRGVRVGEVKDVRINMAGAVQDPKHVRIPVVFEIDVDRVTAKGVTSVDFHDPAQVRALVAVGLRAQLATESMVTGTRYVALDIQPDTPAALVNDPSVAYPEIPSMRSPMELAPDKVKQILDSLADVDFGELAQSVQATVDDAHRLLGSKHLARTLSSLDTVTSSLKRTVAELEASAREVAPMVKSAHQLVAADGRLSTQLDQTLGEVASAARATRRLVEQLTRDPGVIVRGGRP